MKKKYTAKNKAKKYSFKPSPTITQNNDDDFIDENNVSDIVSSNLVTHNNELSLIIVESPGKIKKIKSYLNHNYIVMASVGHIMDLPLKNLGIDLNTLEPSYEIYPDKKKVVNNIKSTIKNNNITNIYIAADADREGEFIGYSLVKLLKLNEYKRIVFHEITKTAINKAITNPTVLDNNMINAQQCRRIMDRLIGFLISPILNKKVKDARSAGRVQSVIVKLILAKQMERDEYWKNNDSTYFVANALFDMNVPLLCPDIFKLKTKMHLKNKEVELIKTNKETMMVYFNLIRTFIDGRFVIVKTVVRDVVNYPGKPFITSTLQQAGFYRYKFSPDKTMKLAQQLYEKGYITYMRTDSPNISQDAIFKIKEYIISTYGETFSHIRQFKSNNQNAQEAHECIRPSNIDVLSENISDVMDDAIKLYKLIWEKTIASQMSENIMKVMDVHIELVIDDATLKKYDISNLFKSPTFIGSIKKVSFIGYKIIYQEDGEVSVRLKNGLETNLGVLKELPREEDETNDDNTTIDFNQNYVCGTDFSNSIKLLEMNSSEQLNSSKPLYNEPSIIKTLEKYSIGRPSTYAALLKKIKDYNYVEIRNVEGFEKKLTEIKFNNKLKVKTIICKEKVSNVGFEKQKLVATDLGKRLVLYLNKYFPHMMDYKFTGNMELKLDQIANGSLDHKIFIKEFYDNLVIWLSNKETN